MIIWALFEDGEQCVVNALNREVISVGIKDKATYKIDLSSFNCIKELEKLPKPDIIVASPPCESWSRASAMEGGNACWKTNFVIRNYQEYKSSRYNYEKQLKKRLNGELTAFNTWKIIEHFKPKYWYIENPKTSMIWKWYKEVLNFQKEMNVANYNCYDINFPKKPTIFMSNTKLNLLNHKVDNGINLEDHVSNYDCRSRIPKQLIIDIFNHWGI